MGKKVGQGMKPRNEDLSATAGQKEVPKEAVLRPEKPVLEPEIPVEKGVPLEAEKVQILETQDRIETPSELLERVLETPEIPVKTPEIPSELAALEELRTGLGNVAFEDAAKVSSAMAQARLEEIFSSPKPNTAARLEQARAESAIRPATPDEIQAVLTQDKEALAHQLGVQEILDGYEDDPEVELGERPDGSYGLVVDIPEGMIGPIREVAAADKITPEEWVTMRLVEYLETWWQPAKGR